MLLTCLTTMALLGIGTGRDAHGCPNEKATEVPARFEEQGTPRRCGLGISLLGLELSIGGEKCFPRRFRYPSHQVCNGEVSEGHYCKTEDDLDVTEEHCECSRLALLGTGFTLPECVCTPVVGGTIEDFGTADCAPTPWGGTSGSGGGLP